MLPASQPLSSHNANPFFIFFGPLYPRCVSRTAIKTQQCQLLRSLSGEFVAVAAGDRCVRLASDLQTQHLARSPTAAHQLVPTCKRRYFIHIARESVYARRCSRSSNPSAQTQQVERSQGRVKRWISYDRLVLFLFGSHSTGSANTPKYTPANSEAGCFLSRSCLALAESAGVLLGHRAHLHLQTFCAAQVRSGVS